MSKPIPLLVIVFLLGLFTYIAWGLNAIVRALDWDPLDPSMSAVRTTIPNTTQENSK